MRSWYDFSDGSGKGTLNLKEFLVGFYYKDRCYDELHLQPCQALTALTFLDDTDSRVFAVFNNDIVLELTAKEVDLRNV